MKEVKINLIFGADNSSIMKKLYPLLLLLCTSLAYSQTTKIDQAELFSQQEDYAAEADIRKEIIASIEDTTTEAYKEQKYKLNAAKSFLTEDPAKMLSLIKEAVSIFNTMKDQPAREKIWLETIYFNNLLWANKNEKALEKANTIYDFALEENKKNPVYGKEIAEILEGMANIAWFSQDYQGAIKYFNRAVEQTKEIYGYYSMKTAENYHFLSIVYSFTSDFNAGLESGEKALEIYEKIQPADKFILFQGYANLFYNYKRYGDIEKATELIQKLTAYYNSNISNPNFANYKHQDFPNIDPVKTIYFYKKLAYAAIVKDTAKVLHYYDLFQNILPKEKVNYSPRERNEIAKYSLETGSFFHRNGDYENAKKHYSNALKFSKENGYNFGVLQAYWILSTAGVDYKKWGDVVFYATEAFKNPDIDKFNQKITLRHNLAYAYFGEKNYDKAVESFEKELNYYSSLGKEVNNFYAIQNLSEIGNVLTQIHQISGDKDQLEKAYSAYYLSSEIFSRLYRGGKFNDRLATLQEQINEGMLFCSLKLNKHLAETAECLERNKSDFLWSHFLKNRNDDFGIAISLAHKKDSLFDQQEYYAGILKDSTNISSDEKTSLREKLEKTTLVYQNSEKELKQNYPSFYRFSNSNFSIAELQSGLNENEVMLRYILTDSLVFAYSITKNNLALKQLPLNKAKLLEKQTAYLSDLKNIHENFQDKSKELFNILLAPMAISEYENVTIICNGFLNYLPFETLLNPDGKYLIENHPIAYSTSLKLWSIQNTIEDNTHNGLLAFSPNYKIDLVASTTDKTVQSLVRSGNYELPGAEQEAKEIHHLFDGKLFTSENATKENFIENSSKFDLLHLAMHAVIDADDPDKSTLLFSNNEKLYLPQLYTMDIPAKLAVLSACNTGFGEIKNGEGVQSLSRAFTFAGVKSTVTSLWPVPDQETSKLMVNFYKNLKKGESKARALQQAKISYLQNTTDSKLKHPYYWAGFVVNGDISPIVSGTTIWLYVILGIVILIGLFVFYRRRKSRV